jgi:cytochrome c-type biogenesis protein CcmH/NrfG
VDRWFVPRRFVQLAEVRHELGRFAEAEAAARRAREIYIAKNDTLATSYSLGHAYVVLGRSLAAQGRVREAREAFATSLRHLVGDNPNAGPSHPDGPGVLRREARRYLAATAP